MRITTVKSMHCRGLCWPALAAILGLCTGCESPGPANPIPPESERQAVAGAFQSAAASHRSRYVLESAGGRGRWSDVPNAIRWAVAPEGVEMGLIDTHELPGGYVFDLVTIEGWPATLTVLRTNDTRVYEASAEVGRFADIIDRGDRAAALVHAFEEWMAALGAKPTLAPAD
jgi:hypothetical protein